MLHDLTAGAPAPCLQDARWTKALKYMLTDLKWCLEWMIVAQEDPQAQVQAEVAVADQLDTTA